jgi:hypothetical protein
MNRSLLILTTFLFASIAEAGGKIVIQRPAQIRVNAPRAYRPPVYVRPAGSRPAPPRYSARQVQGSRGLREVKVTRQLWPGTWQSSTYLQ